LNLGLLLFAVLKIIWINYATTIHRTAQHIRNVIVKR